MLKISIVKSNLWVTCRLTKSYNNNIFILLLLLLSHLFSYTLMSYMKLVGQPYLLINIIAFSISKKIHCLTTAPQHHGLLDPLFSLRVVLQTRYRLNQEGDNLSKV